MRAWPAVALAMLAACTRPETAEERNAAVDAALAELKRIDAQVNYFENLAEESRPRRDANGR